MPVHRFRYFFSENLVAKICRKVDYFPIKTSKKVCFINFVTLIQPQDSSRSGRSPNSFFGILHSTNRSSFLRITEAAIQ